ncbi:MAG: aspartate aminotransferase family protein [Gammaproteobacteria bacterium]|nr:aspartate aminotransferase family protein [Gammaproteobacteria bacterium]NIR98033.1 aspartate aminotransferase family protein [Gammaproteobacteria bacterium]NIT63740.1 aspartate aminotransferase family protein [Gammaproteobacteria bacterium]NIV19915.1 acetylornithine/succinylornithine family transaminase [Gammaproteobacteria bacterium]NIX11404.1 acetylornithine/succinylornithine family transaminase [Gammaproteobacteria bacterium]
MSDRLMNTYGRLPVTFERGEGVWLWDTDGTRYLDAVGGIAVCGLGHAHPDVARALCDQAATLVHTSNLYGIGLQEELARRLTQRSGMESAFFCNSGAEANEAAIKLARLRGHRRGIKEPAIAVVHGSFHGRTLATLSATGNYKIRAGFEPLVRGFVRVEYNDLDILRRVAGEHSDVVAMLVEPVLGEGGVRVPDPGYLAGVRAVCDEHDWLLMVDEVQTGMGRTGEWFGFQHGGIQPDVITLAKALGNGVPIGACLGRGEAADLFHPGGHASTFGGNPLACRAALTVIDVLERERLVEHAAHLGARMLEALRTDLQGLPGVVDIRGQGLMLGVELDRECAELTRLALDAGVLITVTAGRVVRLLPPLVMQQAEADQVVSIVSGLIQEFLAQ